MTGQTRNTIEGALTPVRAGALIGPVACKTTNNTARGADRPGSAPQHALINKSVTAGRLQKSTFPTINSHPGDQQLLKLSCPRPTLQLAS